MPFITLAVQALGRLFYKDGALAVSQPARKKLQLGARRNADQKRKKIRKGDQRARELLRQTFQTSKKEMSKQAGETKSKRPIQSLSVRRKKEGETCLHAHILVVSRGNFIGSLWPGRLRAHKSGYVFPEKYCMELSPFN